MHDNRWLAIDNIIYPGVVRAELPSDTVVILFPGFGFPMSDRDYFMSRIAIEIQSYALVYQFDLRGHGDHMFDLEQTTLSGLKQDIRSILQTIVAECGHSVFCIGRGISPLLCMNVEEESQSNLVSGIIGFNPYMIDSCQLKKIWPELNAQKEKGFIQLGDYVKNAEVRSIFRAMGAELDYISAERLPVEFVKQLELLDPTQVFRHFCGKKAFIYPRYDQGYTMELIQDNEGMKYRKLDKRDDSMLPFNSVWQSQAIGLIKKILYDWRECID